MSWNYRLVITAEDDEGDRDVTICEVYYGKDGKPNGRVGTAAASGPTRQDALAAYNRMRDAFSQPILRKDDEGHLVEVDSKTEQSWLEV